MRTESITIQGFRGFNSQRSIDFSPRLTLVYGANSYGKSSLAEAFEWLLYGHTSREEQIPSKDEFAGSIRNCHLGTEDCIRVELTCLENGSRKIFRAEDEGTGHVARYVDGTKIQSWPFEAELEGCARPLVLQHSLRALLECQPRDRFGRFARLLGLNTLDQLSRDVAALCSKPLASAPKSVQDHVAEASALVARTKEDAGLETAFRTLERNPDKADSAHEKLLRTAQDAADSSSTGAALISDLRDHKALLESRVFSGRVELGPYTSQESSADANDASAMASLLDKLLSSLSTRERESGHKTDSDRLGFLEQGLQMLRVDDKTCPFCGQKIDLTIRQGVAQERDDLRQSTSELGTTIEDPTATLVIIQSVLDRLLLRARKRSDDLTATDKDDSVLEGLLASEHAEMLQSLRSARTVVGDSRASVETSYLKAKEEAGLVREALAKGEATANHAGGLVSSVQAYLDSLDRYRGDCARLAPFLQAAQEIIVSLAATEAGTQQLDLYITLLQDWSTVEKYLAILAVIQGLPKMRKTVESYVAAEVLAAIGERLSDEVQKWYSLIKTEGDPNVHFSGLAIPKTAAGDLRSGRISIEATSYGTSLASAVSCLSESKLNALGLAISVAACTSSSLPFALILFDDPIQSWDGAHEQQFVGIIRTLVEELGKQVIVLSHNWTWLQQVREGCASLNGRYYELTGYTQDGPSIVELDWSPFETRLSTIDGILKDTSADTTRLQQAEEEVRIAAAQCVCRIYAKKKGVKKSPHNLNAAEAHKILIECGVPSKLADGLRSSFTTTDTSHHAAGTSSNPKEKYYTPNRDRVRAYLSLLHELKGYAT